MAENEFITGGLSNCSIIDNEYELFNGIFFKKTNCRFNTSYGVSLNDQDGNHSNSDMKISTIRTNNDIDIEVEIIVHHNNPFHKKIDSDKLIWLIACLLRIIFKPDINVVILTKCGIKNLDVNLDKDVISVFEVNERIFKRDKKNIDSSILEWLKLNIGNAVELIKSDKYQTLLIAFDYSQTNTFSPTSLIAIWGSIEQLILDNAGEITFRLSISLACYIESDSEKRYDLYKIIKKLYGERSRAAHENKPIDNEKFLKSFEILAHVIMKITEENFIPSREHFEKLIFLK